MAFKHFFFMNLVLQSRRLLNVVQKYKVVDSEWGGSKSREGDGGGRGDDGEGDQARGGGGVLGDVGVDRLVAREPARLRRAAVVSM